MSGEDFLLLYLLFAATTAFCAVYELISPTMKSIQAKGVDLPAATWLYYVVSFILSLLTAPVLFLMCIVPSWGLTFRFALEEALLEKQD